MSAIYEDRHADLAAAPPPGRQQQVLERLRGLLPAHAILYREEDMRPFECDALSAFRQMPMIVVLPDTLPEDEFRRLRVVLRYGRPAAAGERSGKEAG